MAEKVHCAAYMTYVRAYMYVSMCEGDRPPLAYGAKQYTCGPYIGTLLLIYHIAVDIISYAPGVAILLHFWAKTQPPSVCYSYVFISCLREEQKRQESERVPICDRSTREQEIYTQVYLLHL